MQEYVKINTIWKRDERGKIVEGDYAMPEFEFLKDCEWAWTEKVDGTNIRVGWDGETVTFGGRTDNAQIPAHLVNALREMFPAEKFAVFDGPVTLYGEGYGAKIQKGGGNYRPDQSFVLFDVQVGGWWLRRFDVESVARTVGIDVVPFVGYGSLGWGIDIVQRGLVSQWGEFAAEGLVGRPAVELFNRRGDRIITKIKARDFTAV